MMMAKNNALITATAALLSLASTAPLLPYAHARPEGHEPCLTEEECYAQVQKSGNFFTDFMVGNYPDAGCFSKNTIAFWGTGGATDEVRATVFNPAAVKKRVWCEVEDGDDVLDLVTAEESATTTTPATTATATTVMPNTDSPIVATDTPTAKPVASSSPTGMPVASSSPTVKPVVTASPSSSPTAKPITNSPTTAMPVSTSPTDKPVTESPTTAKPVTSSPVMAAPAVENADTIVSTTDSTSLAAESTSTTSSTAKPTDTTAAAIDVLDTNPTTATTTDILDIPTTVATVATAAAVTIFTACLTEEQCREQSQEEAGGITEFQVGTYPDAGCFTKNGIAYWGIGGSDAEKSTVFGEGLRKERIWCVVRNDDDADDVSIDQAEIDLDLDDAQSNTTNATTTITTPTDSPISWPTYNPTLTQPSPVPTTDYPTSSPITIDSLAPTEDELSDEENAPRQAFDAVIVGAGWAGIRAAKELLDSGVQSVLVLEANDYIGGRSKTINGDDSVNVPLLFDGTNNDVPIDLGSEFLYQEDNDMEEYLRENGFLDRVDLENEEGDYYLPLEYAQFYMQSSVGGGVNNGSITTEVMDDTEADAMRERVWDNFLEFREELLVNDTQGTSYYSAAEQFKAQLEDDKDKQYLNLILDAGEVDYTGESNQLSLGDYEWFNGELDPMHYMSVPGAGDGNVAASFAAPFSSKIKLGAKVTDINYEDPKNTIISFTKNGVARSVAAKTVLVTVSLGVLKAGAISFTPALPEWKQDVIDNMGFGVTNKCVMVWNDEDDMVWPENKTWFELVTPEDDDSGRWTTFFNPSKAKGVPTLVGWIGGDEARAMETQTDEEVLDDVMKNLQAMFPTIQRPDRIVITRWGQEENILGTYCYKAVGRSFGQDSWNLRLPVGPLRFAGEATAGHWYGSTVGAWKTGEEEAQVMTGQIASIALPALTEASFTDTTVSNDSVTKQPTYTPTMQSNAPTDATGNPAEEPATEAPVDVAIDEEATTSSMLSTSQARPSLLLFNHMYSAIFGVVLFVSTM